MRFQCKLAGGGISRTHLAPNAGTRHADRVLTPSARPTAPRAWGRFWDRGLTSPARRISGEGGVFFINLKIVRSESTSASDTHACQYSLEGDQSFVAPVSRWRVGTLASKDGIAFRASRPPNGSKLQFAHVDFDSRAMTIALFSATGGLDLDSSQPQNSCRNDASRQLSASLPSFR
jgi:hypothetical protein